MDLTAVTRLYDATGPFVSVYQQTGEPVPDAASRAELRWKDLLTELERLGVDEGTRSAVDAARGDHRDGRMRVLFAAGGEVRYARDLPEVVTPDLVRLAALPVVRPLVQWGRTRVPHVVVLTDRQGADVFAYTDGPDPVATDSVDSGRYPVHKVPGGGWSALRYQHTVENSWDQSARDVAAAVARTAAEVNARLLLVAGDVHAVRLLEQHLPEPLRPRVIELDGGRGEDGSDEHVREQVAQTLVDRVDRDAIDRLGDFGQYRGRAADPSTDAVVKAADGPADVVSALRMAQVDTLLLSDELDESATAWFGPQPVQLAMTAEELTGLGVDSPEQAPLVEVVLRAALGTGADVAVVPGGTAESPSGGLGALLRYPAR